MNIALRLPPPKPPERTQPAQEKTHLLEEAGGGTDAEGEGDSSGSAKG